MFNKGLSSYSNNNFLTHPIVKSYFFPAEAGNKCYVHSLPPFYLPAPRKCALAFGSGNYSALRWKYLVCVKLTFIYLLLKLFFTSRSVTSKFGVGKATVWRAVKRVVKAIYRLRNVFIRWPSHREGQETANRIYRRKGFPGVIGALDGTCIRISNK